jgi:hypothetical protein
MYMSGLPDRSDKNTILPGRDKGGVVATSSCSAGVPTGMLVSAWRMSDKGEGDGVVELDV